MERRELLTLLGAGATGLLLTGGTVKANEEGKEEPHDHEQHHAHMKTIGECALTCNMAAAHSLMELRKEGSENREQCVKVAAAANDCQTFCVQTATLMARHSPMAMYAHRACADACRDCAEICEKSQDEKIKKCAEICRECERVCRACCEKTA